MKALTIEMNRTVERKLASGEVHSLKAGERYTMDSETAAPYLVEEVRVVRDASVSGGLKQVTLPPAAKILRSVDIPDVDDEAQAKAAADKATERAKVANAAYFKRAREEEAIASGVMPQAAATTADVIEDGG